MTRKCYMLLKNTPLDGRFWLPVREFFNSVYPLRYLLEEKSYAPDPALDCSDSPFRWAGFYFGPPYHYYGGGLGLVLLILLVVVLVRGH